MSKINKVNDKLLGGLSSVWNDGRFFDNKVLDGAYNVCKIPVILGGVVASGVLYVADKAVETAKLMKNGVSKSNITFDSKKVNEDKTVLVGNIKHSTDIKKEETKNVSVVAGDVAIISMNKKEIEELSNLKAVLGSLNLGEHDLSELSNLTLVKGSVFVMSKVDTNRYKRVINQLEEIGNYDSRVYNNASVENEKYRVR